MSSYIKTTYPGFVRDSDTKAIINMNHGEYENLKALREKNKILNKYKCDLDELKCELQELRDQFKKVLK